jgi:S-DNA-T family DNA segregation ATPase FtsK/SpoIIIE
VAARPDAIDPVPTPLGGPGTAGPAPEAVRPTGSPWSAPDPPVAPLTYESIAHVGGEPLQLPIGLQVEDSTPVQLDVGTDPHLLIEGGPGSGRSSLLGTLAATISRRCTTEQARIILVDHRNGLWSCVQTEHLIGYGASAEQSRELIASVAGYMNRRLPGPDVTAEQRRDRSWWRGPECFILVDDYDRVAGAAADPLAPLLGYLPVAREIGLHLVVAGPRDALAALHGSMTGPGGPARLVLPGPSGSRHAPEAPLPPGRGRLTTSSGESRLVQLALPPAQTS